MGLPGVHGEAAEARQASGDPVQEPRWLSGFISPQIRCQLDAASEELCSGRIWLYHTYLPTQSRIPPKASSMSLAKRNWGGGVGREDSVH